MLYHNFKKKLKKIRGEKFWAKNSDINTDGFADQNAGDIIINTVDLLSMTDKAWIISSSFNQGKSGSINIQINELSLSGKSAITSMNFGQGNAGDITIRVLISVQRSSFTLCISCGPSVVIGKLPAL